MEALKTRFAAFSKASAEVTRKAAAGAAQGVGRVKEMFAQPTVADRLVEEATAETAVGPDWAKSLELCDMVNNGQTTSADAVRAIKKRLALRNFHVQLLVLVLLETVVKNCERLFAEVASEKLLDDMVRLVDDAEEPREVRDKALQLIEAWGESTEELRYLPVFEETYKSLKSRGVRFPGRDGESLAPIFTPAQTHPVTTRPANLNPNGAPADHPLNVEDSREVLTTARNGAELLTTVLTSAPPKEALQDELASTLLLQCQESQSRVQRIVETAAEDEGLMFEALSVHDELEKVLKLHSTLLEESGLAPPSSATAESTPANAEPATIPVVQSELPELKDLRVGDETEDATAGGLVRNRAATGGGAKMVGGGSDDEAAMKDLDDMIFGKTSDTASTEASSGAPPPASSKKSEDMIVF